MSRVGDADASQLYNHVGMALSSWGVVESMFALLFTQFIDAKTPGAGHVFGRLQGLMGKVDALTAATGAAFFQHRVGDEDRNDWELLLSHYREATTRRNEIAHGMVMGYRIEDEDRGHFLVPVTYAKKSHAPWIVRNPVPDDFLDRFGGQYRYTSSDIAQFGTKFSELRDWAIKFSIAYRAKYSPPANAG